VRSTKKTTSPIHPGWLERPGTLLRGHTLRDGERRDCRVFGLLL
jgi:hypothetical protein